MKTQRFQDFDEFAGSVHGVDIRMLMRDPRQRAWSISHIQLGELELQVGILGSGNIASGQMSPDGYILYLPLTEGIEYLGNGTSMDRRCCFLMEPRAEFCISTTDSHDWASVFLPTHRMSEQTLDLCSKSCRVIGANQKLVAQLIDVYDEIIRAASDTPEFESTSAAARAADEIQQLASSIIEKSDSGPTEDRRTGRTRISRDKIVRRAMLSIEQSKDLRFSIAELANACHISERTLRSVWHDYFGVGPVRYLQVRELNQIHRALKVASPAAKTVAGILAEHGIWAHGRFAQRYQRLFGELPSETLAKP